MKRARKHCDNRFLWEFDTVVVPLHHAEKEHWTVAVICYPSLALAERPGNLRTWLRTMRAKFQRCNNDAEISITTSNHSVNSTSFGQPIVTETLEMQESDRNKMPGVYNKERLMPSNVSESEVGNRNIHLKKLQQDTLKDLVHHGVQQPAIFHLDSLEGCLELDCVNNLLK